MEHIFFYTIVKQTVLASMIYGSNRSKTYMSTARLNLVFEQMSGMKFRMSLLVVSRIGLHLFESRGVIKKNQDLENMKDLIMELG